MLFIQELRQQISVGIADHRRTSHGNIRYVLSTLLIIAFLGMLCNRKTYRAIYNWAIMRSDWLKEHLDLSDSIPGPDTIRRCLEKVDPSLLARCFRNIGPKIDLSGQQISLDGKTMKGSGNEDHKPYHVLSAYADGIRVSLAEVAVGEKKNEITMAHDLLALLHIEGAIVSTDAIMTQTKIAQDIHERKADYCLTLKKNHPNLFKDVQELFGGPSILSGETFTKEAYEEFIKNSEINIELLALPAEKGHGRVEERFCALSTEIKNLYGSENWTGLEAVGMSVTKSFCNGKEGFETRFHLLSFTDLKLYARCSRQHWGIEVNHYKMDVFLGEDACRVTKDFAPLNQNIFRKESLRFIETCLAQCDPRLRLTIGQIAEFAHGSEEFMEKVLKGEAINPFARQRRYTAYKR